MQDQIISKLNNVLTIFQNEQDVVYILSRVRKIWETMGKPSKYNGLVFYCDWALHIEIGNTNRVKKELKQFIDNTFENEFIDFTHFRKEFKVFLEDFNLSKLVVEDEETFNIFRKFMLDIYSDTPLYIGGDINKKITLNKNIYKTKNQYFGVSFSISPIE